MAYSDEEIARDITVAAVGKLNIGSYNGAGSFAAAIAEIYGIVLKAVKG